MGLPGLNSRILELIEQETLGKVKPFSEMIGFRQPQKLNRLFKPDSRNGEYPMPSTDIILAILEKFTDVNIEWLLQGIGNPKKSDYRELSNQNASPSEKDVMKVIEMIYLHEDILLKNKMFVNWLSEKENKIKNQTLKEVREMNSK